MPRIFSPVDINTLDKNLQKDYFDRLVRNEAHFERCVRYIRSNPKKAGLKDGEFLLWEAERAKAVL